MKRLLRKIKNWWILKHGTPEKIKPSATPVDVTPGVGAPKWLVKFALERTTGVFEGCGAGQITGNFDKQGMSWGWLQWCIGQGSLQSKILRPFMKAHESDYIHILHMNELCNLSTKKAVRLAASLFKDPQYRQHAKKFMETPEVVELQLEAAADLGSRAWKLATIHFGTNEQNRIISFLWFFDVLVQNGSLKGIPMPTASVMDKYRHLADRYCPESPTCGFVNTLLVWSYLRSRKSHRKWQSDVFRRKATLAVGRGTVHDTRFINIHTDVIRTARKNNYEC